MVIRIIKTICHHHHNKNNEPSLDACWLWWITIINLIPEDWDEERVKVNLISHFISFNLLRTLMEDALSSPLSRSAFIWLCARTNTKTTAIGCIPFNTWFLKCETRGYLSRVLFHRSTNITLQSSVSVSSHSIPFIPRWIVYQLDSMFPPRQAGNTDNRAAIQPPIKEWKLLTTVNRSWSTQNPLTRNLLLLMHANGPQIIFARIAIQF